MFSIGLRSGLSAGVDPISFKILLCKLTFVLGIIVLLEAMCNGEFLQ